jgi:hypothetical protein
MDGHLAVIKYDLKRGSGSETVWTQLGLCKSDGKFYYPHGVCPNITFPNIGKKYK